MEPVVWRDGKIIGWDDARLHVFSHAVSRGSSIFEVLTAEQSNLGTILFRPVEHIRRLFQSASYINMKVPYNVEELVGAMKKTVKVSSLHKAIVKIMALWPSVEFELIPRNRDVSVLMAAIPFPPLRNEKGSRKRPGGVKARIVSVRKIDPATVPVKAKVAANYVNAMLAKMEAIRRGADIPIMLDTKGNLAEGSTESLFIVRGGILFTPSEENILSGITRDSVIRLAKEIGLTVKEKRLKPELLKKADEVFFTASPDHIIHARSVDGRRIGSGVPGPITKKLCEYFEKVVCGEILRYKKWLVSVR